MELDINLAGYELKKLEEIAELLKISTDELALIFIKEVVHTY